MHYAESKERGQQLIKNVSENERLITGVGGVMLSMLSMRRGGLGGLLGVIAGGWLVSRAATGHCELYSRYGMDDQERRLAEQHGWSSAAVSRESIIVNRPREQIYQFWRDASNLAKVMSHVDRVDLLDSKRSHWVMALPLGRMAEWDSQITEDQPNERIAWDAEQNADLRNSGWVEFRDAPGGQGTEVIVQLSFEPPGGDLGHIVAKLWPNSPGALLKSDLRQFKHKLESGELSLVGGGERPGGPPAQPGVHQRH